MLKHGHIAPETTFSFSVPENSTPCRIDRYIADLFPEGFDVVIRDVKTVDKDLPLRRLVEPADEVDESRLSRSLWPYHTVHAIAREANSYFAEGPCLHKFF